MKHSIKVLREPAIVTVLVVALISLFHHIRYISWIGSLLTLITATLLIYTPIVVYWIRKEPFNFLDRSLAECRQGFKTFVVFSLAIFPILVVGNHYYQDFVWGARFRGSMRVQPLVTFFINQMLFISLPEEFFYRGYLQDRINRSFDKTWNIFGAACGPGWILTAIVFAASHSAITFRWWHAFIFFPGLAFGWLREKTGTIFAPILFHAACNTFAYWAFRAYA